MKKTFGLVIAAVVCATSLAYAAEKKAPPDKTIGEIIVDIVTAPVKLVQDLMKK